MEKKNDPLVRGPILALGDSGSIPVFLSIGPDSQDLMWNLVPKYKNLSLNISN